MKLSVEISSKKTKENIIFLLSMTTHLRGDSQNKKMQIRYYAPNWRLSSVQNRIKTKQKTEGRLYSEKVGMTIGKRRKNAQIQYVDQR